jgi:hypothetical protein
MNDADAARRLAALADTLFPGAEGMPRASDAADYGAGLTAFLNGRPDLRGEVMRGLRAIAPDDIAGVLATLPEVDPEAWKALGLACAWIYYSSAEVQRRLGYHGPERRTYDADAVPAYVSNGMLDVVLKAGPIWRAASAD